MINKKHLIISIINLIIGIFYSFFGITNNKPLVNSVLFYLTFITCATYYIYYYLSTQQLQITLWDAWINILEVFVLLLILLLLSQFFFIPYITFYIVFSYVLIFLSVFFLFLSRKASSFGTKHMPSDTVNPTFSSSYKIYIGYDYYKHKTEKIKNWYEQTNHSKNYKVISILLFFIFLILLPIFKL